MAEKSRSSINQMSAQPFAFIAHLVAMAVTTLVLVWLLHFKGGLAFNSALKQKIFNVHPFLMGVGFILFAGEGILAFKTVPGARKTQKIVHLILHFIALDAGIVGIYAVFKFHDEIGASHMETLHSWFGMATISLFGVQWLLGFFSFMWPGAEMGARARLAPWHVFFGILIFFMTIVTAQMGLAESFIFSKLGKSQQGVIVNFIGVLLLLFGISVGVSVLLRRRETN